MINDARDLLGVAFEDGHDLFRILVEDRGVAVVASGQDAAVVGRIDVQRQDARHAGRMQTLGKETIQYYNQTRTDICVKEYSKKLKVRLQLTKV